MADQPTNLPPNDPSAFDQAFAGVKDQSGDQSFEDAFAKPVTAPNLAAMNPPSGEAPAATANGPVNVFNPTGDLVSIPGHQLQEALQSGYKEASPQDIAHFEKEQKYGTTGQQLATGLEGAAEAATFGLSTGAEQALGVNAEDIRNRRETNPNVHMAGQMAGLVGSAFIPGVGEANLLEHAGAGAAALAGLDGASMISKIGSAAVKSAAENALFQGGDEVSKLLSRDPNQSAQTALTDIGLSGVLGGALGGAFGSINPLWKATMGAKTEGVLKAVTDHLGGVDGAANGALADNLAKAGLEDAPEVIKAALSDNDAVRRTASLLNQTDTAWGGRQYQKASEEFRQKASDRVLEALNTSPEAVEKYSVSDHGRAAMNTFKEEYKAISDPVTKIYERVNEKFRDTPLTEAAFGSDANPYKSARTPQASIADKLGELADRQGYDAVDPRSQIIKYALSKLPKVETIQDLSKLNTAIGELSFADPVLRNVGREVKDVILNSQQELLGNVVGREAPELFNDYMSARQGYAKLARISDEAGSNLSTGSFKGPKEFLKVLEEKRTPEEFLKKLSPKGNAEVIPFLAEHFPQTLEKIRQNELLEAVKPALKAAKDTDGISIKTLQTKLASLDPAVRDFVLPQGASDRISAVGDLLEKLNDPRHNFSNTARVANALFDHTPGAALGLIAMLTGHGAAESFIVGNLVKTLGTEAPAAIKYGLLKFLGSTSKIDSGGFKAMVDYIQHTIKAENTLGNAAKNIFKAGRDVLPQSIMPSETDRKRLDKKLQEIQVKPEALLNTGGATGHYLPEHTTALSQTAVTAANFINSQRPDVTPKSPMDTKMPPTPVQKAAFDRLLNIGQQPLSVMPKIKDGTITPGEIMALRTMYPDLYNRITAKLTEEATATMAKGNVIPYKTRIGLSMFTGLPLDSTMTPAGIMGAQPKPPQPQPGTATTPPSGPKHSMTALNKNAASYQTPGQAREAKRQND